MRTNEDIIKIAKYDEAKTRRILERNIDQVVTEEEFWKKIRSGRKLRVKHGVDPTNPFLHLGHAVNYWKMRELQELGHKVVILIGDFTAQIGDPTGRSKARPELSLEEANKNAQEYLEQISKILINKPDILEIRRNSEWYGKMRLADFLGLCRKITHSRLIERDMFQRRLKKQKEIYMHELLYPILQGYDSVMIKSDLTVIGSDQLFNELIGRHFQEIFGASPQVVMTTVITPGLDGKEKMSKSLGNYVAILDTPRDKFGKLMTLPDELIHSYFMVYTGLAPEEIKDTKKLHPFEAKKKLAYEIVKLYHGEKEALRAKNYFEKTFSKKETPKELPAVKILINETWGEFLVRNQFARSKSDAKRLIAGGAIDLDSKKILNVGAKVKPGMARIGKFKFIKIEA